MPSGQPQTSESRQWIPDFFWEIEVCLPYSFKREEEKDGGYSWSWTSRYSELHVHVRVDTVHDIITIYVRDTKCDKTIKLWTSKVNMTGAWMNRLRRAVGEAHILAQRRPKCPKCHGETEVRERRSDSAQFFGCVSYPDCNGLVNIIDHDIERKRAASVSAHAAQTRPQSAAAVSR
jgi:hypothetical protein